MISRKQLHRLDAGRNTSYYTDQLDDYYNKESADGSHELHDTASQWQGKGAQDLGLQGKVDPIRFSNMLRGEIAPGLRTHRTVRSDADKRTALDLTFSAPKSISIQALVGKDPAVVQAHDRAVTATIEYIERELTRARRSVNGQTFVERTDNLVVAKWRHETARPTADAPPDPQLHTHAIVMNFTKRTDGSWVALSNEEIIRHIKLLDAVYLSELARELELNGYSLRHEAGSFELANITREQIEVFSKRSQQVNDELAKQNLTRLTASHARKQSIVLAKRLKKMASELSRASLQRNWEAQAEDADIEFTRPDLATAAGPKPPHLSVQQGGKPVVSQTNGGQPTGNSPATPPPNANPNIIARQALEWAIDHFTEREAVMERELLLNKAFQHAGSLVTIHDLEQELAVLVRSGHVIEETARYASSKQPDKVLTPAEWINELCQAGTPHAQAMTTVRDGIAKGRLVSVAPRYTTPAARDREKRILQIERDGRSAVAPVMDKLSAQARLEEHAFTPGQLNAALGILTTSNRVIGIQGLAGTGKSYLLGATQTVLKEHGYKVVALASYGSQVDELRANGIEAKTVASFVSARKREKFGLDDKTVLVVDEAGVLASRNMERVLELAEQAGVRVVLLGDTGQTKAIEAGRPFAQLQDAGMQTALMADIQRQKEVTLRQAVENAAKGNVAESITLLGEHVTEVRNKIKRYEAIAQAYSQLSEAERAQTLVLTGTNDSRLRINGLIHAALGLQGKGLVRELLTRKDTTQAERRHAPYYNVGEFIEPERTYQNGLEKGTLYKVMAVGSRTLSVQACDVPDAPIITFNPATATGLSIYQLQSMELSPGDKVRTTRHNASLDLATGGLYTVESVAADSITLKSDDRTVTVPGSAPLHMDLAYAGTVHGSQGQTRERVIMNIETASLATKRDTFYVGISRAKSEVEIFTDKKLYLAQAVSRAQDKTAALDVQERSAAEALPPKPGQPAPTSRTSANGALKTRNNQQAPVDLAAQQAVTWAIQHHSERESVITRSSLLTDALKHGATATSLPSVQAEVERRVKTGHLVPAEPRYISSKQAAQAKGKPHERDSDRTTTEGITATGWANQLEQLGMSSINARKTVRLAILQGRLIEAEPAYTTHIALAREKRILKIERDGRGAVAPIFDAGKIQAKLSGTSLQPGQLAAAASILSTTNRVVGVQGLAGTGKSYMLSTVKEELEGQQFKTFAIAAYDKQVQELLSLGIEAQTVESFIRSRQPELFGLDHQTVLIVDEAGVLPSRAMEKVLQLAERFNTRVVLLGDTGQTKAIEAGRPFAQLQEAGMTTSLMGDIRRQQDSTLKQAVELAAASKTSTSVGILKDHITEYPDTALRYQAIANDYVALSPDERKETLILTGTNNSRSAINQAVHAALGLQGKGEQRQVIITKDTTQAQRRHAKYYSTDEFLQPERNYSNGLKAGELYRITDVTDRSITVQSLSDPHSTSISFNPAKANKLTIYKINDIEISPGDTVRATRDMQHYGIKKGEELHVQNITGDSIELTNGTQKILILGSEALPLDWGYAKTVHGTQGQTKDRVLFNIETNSLTTKSDVYYVGISRERHHLTIYTDSKKKLPAAISRQQTKTAALDIAARPASPQLAPQAAQKRDLQVEHEVI